MNSWDCFDTLIGRSFNYPRSIFDIVGQKIGDPSFIHKRIRAEKISLHKTYDDIYRHLRGYDPSIELETEKEFTFPILENWNRVKDGDIIISDMYLSSQQIRELLEHHGFNKDVKILSTYGGKHSGNLWNTLKAENCNIQHHYGDNLHSDVKMCRQKGFNGIFFAGSILTDQENFLIKNNQRALAFLMRRARLSNPYNRPRSLYYHSRGSFQNTDGHSWVEEIDGKINFFTMIQNLEDRYVLKSKNHEVFVELHFDGISFIRTGEEKEFSRLYSGNWLDYEINYESESQRLIWIDQSQFNLPILVLSTLSLPQHKKLVFSQRDCLYLNKVYNSLLEKQAPMLEVCRKSYMNPFNREYVDYVIDSTKDAIIVDSHGSGYSANKFFSDNNLNLELYHIFKHYLDKNQKGLLRSNTDVELGCQMECTSLGGRTWFCPGRSFEKYNIHYNGPLVGWKNGRPVRRRPEHDRIISTTIEKTIDSICSYLYVYKNSIDPNISILPNLSKKLKHTFTDIIVNSIGK